MQGFGRLALPFAACALTLALAAAAPAADTSFWRSETFEDFEAGEPSGTSILQDGRVVLSYDFEEVSLPEAQYVWAAAEHGGDVYAVAGTPGRLYRIRGDDVELLWEVDTPDLTALAVDPSGRVFVGTAPGGEVYEVRPDGSHELFFETGEGYVWAMTYSPEHGLVVGTGDSARVFVVDDDGDGEAVHESSEASVSRLASVDGRILAGTAVGGMLLDVTPGRDLMVLHDSRYDEVTGIAVGPDGNTYFSAAGILLDEAFGDSELEGGLGEGSVFRTTAGGGVIELWHSPDAPLTALGAGPDGEIWVGTGSRGRIVSVGPRGRVALVADLAPEEILSIASSEGGAVVTTGLSGSVFVSGAEAGESGALDSDVFDARSRARWGELSWRAETPGGSRIRLSSRSGNTEAPGEAWSGWARISGDTEGAVESPAARFLQWRAELTGGSGGATPALTAVEVAFLRENLPPVITGVRVTESSDAYSAGGFVGDPVTQTLPSGLEVTYSLRPDAPPPRDLPVLTRGLRTAEWEAHDPNDDLLSYDVWVRAEDEGAWKVLAEDLDRSAHTWDTQSMPDGRYRLKVRADDGPENPPDQAGSDERESAPFVVDNTPPEFEGVEASRDGETIVVGGRAGDALSPIVRVEVALDYGQWRSAFAEDGMFDSLEEAFDLTVSGQAGGEHAVTIRAIDRAGNVATARRVVR
jgi:outer membrane protein assembly factor BamB